MQRSQRLRQAEEALLLGRRQVQERQFAEAVDSFDRGLEQLSGVIGKGSAWDELLSRQDMIEMAVLWSMCRVQLATATEVSDARQAVLHLLDEAESLLGSDPALTRERSLQVHAQGNKADTFTIKEARLIPRTAWEHFSLGNWRLREGRLDQAAESFNQAIDLSPKDFWPWFGKGLCAYRRQQTEEAITAFTVCVAIAPDSAICYYNRGLALAARGDSASALRDYNKALQIDPALAGAAQNRGALYLREQLLGEAEADFQRAQALGANEAAVQYDLGLVYQARKQPAAALACLERALEIEPGHVPSQQLRARLLKQQKSGEGKPKQGH